MTVGSKLEIGGCPSKQREKLPLIKAYMESVVETLEEFQIRKIKWAVKELENEGKELTFWNIVETAGVKPRYMGGPSKLKELILQEEIANVRFW